MCVSGNNGIASIAIAMAWKPILYTEFRMAVATTMVNRRYYVYISDTNYVIAHFLSFSSVVFGMFCLVGIYLYFILFSIFSHVGLVFNTNIIIIQ